MVQVSRTQERVFEYRQIFARFVETGHWRDLVDTAYVQKIDTIAMQQVTFFGDMRSDSSVDEHCRAFIGCLPLLSDKMVLTSKNS